jgi:hypothetical protein
VAVPAPKEISRVGVFNRQRFCGCQVWPVQCSMSSTVQSDWWSAARMLLDKRFAMVPVTVSVGPYCALLAVTVTYPEVTVLGWVCCQASVTRYIRRATGPSRLHQTPANDQNDRDDHVARVCHTTCVAIAFAYTSCFPRGHLPQLTGQGSGPMSNIEPHSVSTMVSVQLSADHSLPWRRRTATRVSSFRVSSCARRRPADAWSAAVPSA